MPATNPTPTPASGPRRPSLTNRLVLSIVRSPAHGVLLGSTTALRYAAGDGHEVTLPVWYVQDEGRLVLLVGRSAAKRWWRHFRAPRPVGVWWQGRWRSTNAQAFAVGSPEHDSGAAAYRRQHRHISTADDPIVVVAIPR